MQIGTYFNCLQSLGTSTGSFEGIYNLSGDNKIAYNEIYSTGQNYLSGLILAANYPLIQLNGNSISTGFTSNSCFSFGQNISGDFSVLLQLDNPCLRTTTGIDQILFSTISNYSSINNGLIVGVTDTNMLYIQNSNNYSILDKQLKNKNFIYFSVNNKQYVNLGIFDILNNKYSSTEFVLQNPLSTNNTLYLGGFLNNNLINFTGFSGNVNFVSLFNQTLNINDIINCIDCSMITGVNIIGTGTNYFQAPILGNYSTYTLLTTGVTGTVYISGNLTNSLGNNVPIYTSSGITGIISGNTFGAFSSTLTGITLNENPIYSYQFNTGIYNQFLTYNCNFYLPLVSGDYVEIYTYNYFNSKIANKFDSLFDYPDTNFNVQVINNGLIQTFGIEYNLDIEGEIIGFYPDDIIEYDLTSGNSIVTEYSGWWNRSKILMSGGGYFPSTSQYIESGSGVIITGLFGIPINSNTDLYLNGQKLISGLQYSFFASGQLSNILVLSGNYLPDFDYTALYSPTGGLPTGVTNLESNDLMFYPREDLPNHYLFSITGNVGILNNIVGFSPQIWINGIRQYQNNDYVKNFTCDLNSGFINSFYNFQFYNNETTNFNI